MTLREKVQQEDPHCAGPEFEGGAAGCPGDYGYLNTDIDFCLMNALTVKNAGIENLKNRQNGKTISCTALCGLYRWGIWQR